ncbi:MULTISPECIES: hypothetical protein [unclassified Pseudomonas]|uniref:hypothetical protein n=1 Tax=unclassified Pseudomonas TaxID=196821 RepID=UPI000A0E7C59|nr:MULTISPECIES: hypothetical protein [unclassified Pseudomonas]SMF23365.1 hypothetical protein SAMN02745962_02418 [Pseudomonas sp. LAIL14HWK12:I11]SMR74300.1 hypothetical protein SAMN05661028_01992 [Pseudomonas sp. LAIL14HWK12:I10]SOD03529.1 hypothetical protein SAMN05660296_02423 [Pseudomonas sp. LAIL14HWK12:I8]
MNAIALTTNHETDYRDAMQCAAVAYLFRREGLHLSGDHQVLDICSTYLAQSLEVPAHLVQRIAELAVAEFESKTTKRLQMIGVCASSGIFRPRLILLDTITQHRYQVPARYLPRRMLHHRNT